MKETATGNSLESSCRVLAEAIAGLPGLGPRLWDGGLEAACAEVLKRPGLEKGREAVLSLAGGNGPDRTLARKAAAALLDRLDLWAVPMDHPGLWPFAAGEVPAEKPYRRPRLVCLAEQAWDRHGFVPRDPGTYAACPVDLTVRLLEAFAAGGNTPDHAAAAGVVLRGGPEWLGRSPASSHSTAETCRQTFLGLLYRLPDGRTHVERLIRFFETKGVDRTVFLKTLVESEDPADLLRGQAESLAGVLADTDPESALEWPLDVLTSGAITHSPLSRIVAPMENGHRRSINTALLGRLMQADSLCRFVPERRGDRNVTVLDLLAQAFLLRAQYVDDQEMLIAGLACFMRDPAVAALSFRPPRSSFRDEGFFEKPVPLAELPWRALRARSVEMNRPQKGIPILAAMDNMLGRFASWTAAEKVLARNLKGSTGAGLLPLPDRDEFLEGLEKRRAGRVMARGLGLRNEGPEGSETEPCL
jgi:hypothetical protein